jgi:hypothetical protein
LPSRSTKPFSVGLTILTVEKNRYNSITKGTIIAKINIGSTILTLPLITSFG